MRRLHFTMGLQAGQTPQSFCMNAWFKGHLATFTQNSSMRIDFAREKKSFSFFVI